MVSSTSSTRTRSWQIGRRHSVRRTRTVRWACAFNASVVDDFSTAPESLIHAGADIFRAR